MSFLRPVPHDARAVPRARLDPFSRWSWRTFGRRARALPDPKLEEDLGRAHWRFTPEEYRAVAIGATVVAAAGALLGALAVLFFARNALGAPLSSLLAIALVLGVPASVYAVVRDLPNSRALSRRTAISRELPAALHFVAVMSCADVPVDEIFRELAAQPLYGEVCAEAAWIVRDIDLLGVDVLSALGTAARRSPSAPCAEFLQGIVTTAESGGDLHSYFLAQADRLERERSVKARGEIDRLGTYAEAYVTIAVAFPLFLLVLLSVFTLIAGGAEGLLGYIWLTALLLIPAVEIAFGLLFRSVGADP